MIEYLVQKGDVISVASDLLILKYAQELYGADAVVARHLISSGVCTREDIRLLPGEFALIETRNAIVPKRVLFLGTPQLEDFTYDQMQLFSHNAIEIIEQQAVSIKVVTTTVHGVGYGLDGGESLQRLIQGFREGLYAHRDVRIEKIVFLTRDEREERMLAETLRAVTGRDGSIFSSTGRASDIGKKHVFVAMSYSALGQNTFEYGIYPAVRNCGMICEKTDKTQFTGDILKRIKESIESASLVIADLTEKKPNVYLEVGYAWGKGVPVIFIARKGQRLPFDVSTHKCIYYGEYKYLVKDIEDLIKGITRAE
jgi:hypothetical protein